MRLTECWPLLAILISYGNGVWAQDFQGEYRFRDPESSIALPAWFPGHEQSSRWAPQVLGPEVNANVPGPGIQPVPQGNAFAPPATDYAEPPPGLPRGLYRQVEQRHTITPHIEGYRFRPIEPEEQIRNKERIEEERSSGTTDTTQMPNRHEFYNGYVPQESRQPKAVYRPDKRLDKGSRQGIKRYPYDTASPMPQFRPQ